MLILREICIVFSYPGYTETRKTQLVKKLPLIYVLNYFKLFKTDESWFVSADDLTNAGGKSGRQVKSL